MAQLIPSGEFVTSGEKSAAKYLRENLPADWIVISNKTLTFPNGTAREVDFIILGRNRLFVADEKGFRGHIHGNENYWVLDSNESRESPLNKIEGIARRLAGVLRDRIPFLRDNLGEKPIVDALILLSDDTAQVHVQEPRQERILRLAGCEQTLLKLDQRAEEASLFPFRQQIVEFLRVLKPRPTRLLKLGGYHILEELKSGSHYRAFLAEHEAGGANARRRLKMYELQGVDDEERERHKDIIYRDYHALARLADTGIVPTVDSPFLWSDNQFIVIPQHTPAFPSWRLLTASALLDASAALSVEDRLKLGVALLDSLATLHQNGILHRNLTPDNVFVNATADKYLLIFSDFDFARLSDATSIAVRVSDLLTESPYAAPEVTRGLQPATAATDIYAVGVMLAELFSGQDAPAMRDANSAFPVPLLSAIRKDLTPQEADDLHANLTLMTEVNMSERWASAAEAGVSLRELLEAYQARQPKPASPASASQSAEHAPDAGRKASSKKEMQTKSSDRLFQRGELIADQYEVEQVLKSGATAHTYLVRDVWFEGLYVLKQICDPEQAQALTANEFQLLRALPPHPGIVKIHDARPPTAPFHLRLEYVEGESIFDSRHEFPWSPDKTLKIAFAILNALTHLERNGLAHRDISARNVILTPSGPKLIDFGFASRLETLGQTVVGTRPFRAPELDRGEGWNRTCDLYSVSVLLCQILTGVLPFPQDLNGNYDKEHPYALDAAVFKVSVSPTENAGDKDAVSEEDTVITTAEIQRKADTSRRNRILEVLLRAVDPHTERRFNSAQEFDAALRIADIADTFTESPQDGARVLSEWVRNIQGLYRNSQVGNADNRGLDTDFAQLTYVPTRLDNDLLPDILAGKYSVVLLSGNPGDGKTAFLEKLGEELIEQGAKQEGDNNANGWHYKYQGRLLAANYDASESHNGRRADELLDAILEPLQGDTPPQNTTYTALLAINDGKLRAFLLGNPKYGWLDEQVGRALADPEAVIDARIALVDLKQRSVVGDALDTPCADIFEQVLTALLRADHWQECLSCRARKRCAIKFNRDSLADTHNGETLRGRLRSLFQITHLRRERHITMRDLRSSLAYIIAGTATCDQIHRELETNHPAANWQNRLYFMAAANPAKEAEDNLADFVLYDPALTPTPRLDRFFNFRKGSERRDEIDALMLPLAERSPYLLNALHPAALGPFWHQAQKRRLFFEGDSEQLRHHAQSLPDSKALLPYRHLEAFLDAVGGRASLDTTRDLLCEAISRANGIIDRRQYGEYLCIRTGHDRAVDLTVYKRFPRADFACRIVQPRAEQLETLPNALHLRHLPSDTQFTSDAQLTVELDLFEILMRFTEGYQAGVEEQIPLLTDLAQFQNRLLNQMATELLLVEGGRKVHRVRQRNGIIELVGADESLQ